MTSPPASLRIGAGAGEYPQLLADLFHALNQPLTTLRCCLEVSLQRPRRAERYRQDLRTALQQAESVTELTAGIRALVDAAHPRDGQQRSDLNDCIRKVVNDLLPLAEAAGVELRLDSHAPYYVGVEASRLRQALLHLFEFALNRCAAGARVEIQAAERKHQASLTIHMAGLEQSGRKPPGRSAPLKISGLDRRLALAITRNIIESSGGSFRTDNRAGHLWLKIALPLVSQEPALPLA